MLRGKVSQQVSGEAGQVSAEPAPEVGVRERRRTKPCSSTQDSPGPQCSDTAAGAATHGTSRGASKAWFPPVLRLKASPRDA